MCHAMSSTALVLLTATLLFAVGCSTSTDTQVWESTRLHPANIAVIDTSTNRELWRMEVPVGHKLEIDFNHAGLEREGTRVSELPASEMTWYLYDVKEPYKNASRVVGDAVASDTVSLNGHPVRAQLSFRSSPAISGEGLYRVEQLTRPSSLETDETEESQGSESAASPGDAGAGESAAGPPSTQPATQPAADEPRM